MAHKAKTFKGISKRVRLSGTGKLMHGIPFSNHFLSKKRSSRKRTYATMQTIDSSDMHRAKRLKGVS